MRCEGQSVLTGNTAAEDRDVVGLGQRFGVPGALPIRLVLVVQVLAEGDLTYVESLVACPIRLRAGGQCERPVVISAPADTTAAPSSVAVRLL